MLTREEEEQCIVAMHRGCQKSFTRLVKAHERLVFSLARFYSRHNCPRDELVSEGMLALVVAIKKFELGRGARLNTYARWWIIAYMRKFTLDNRRVVQPPHTQGARRVLARLRSMDTASLAQTNTRQSSEEIAQALEVETREVEEIRAFLDARDLGTDGMYSGERLFSRVQTPETITIEQQHTQMFRDALYRALGEMPAREQLILQARLLQPIPERFATIGERLGLTRQRIQQISVEAQARLFENTAAYLATAKAKRRAQGCVRS